MRTKGAALAPCQAPALSRSLDTCPQTQTPEITGPEVSTVLHKLIWFYWIIGIWMTFNKLIVRRKQKNDHRPGYHGLLSQAPYLGPACPCSLRGCPSWPWQLTLGKGQERLWACNHTCPLFSPLTSQYSVFILSDLISFLSLFFLS